MLKTYPALVFIVLVSVPSSYGQRNDSIGTVSNINDSSTAKLEEIGTGYSSSTQNQRSCSLPTGLSSISRTRDNAGLSGLPPTTLEGFVKQNEEVFGDEGIIRNWWEDGRPPFDGFDEQHRLARVIADPNPDLTTDHTSLLPSAWGKDEFTVGEMSISGLRF